MRGTRFRARAACGGRGDCAIELYTWDNMNMVFYAYHGDYDSHISLIIASTLEKAQDACEQHYRTEIVREIDCYLGKFAIENMLDEDEDRDFMQWKREEYERDKQRIEALPASLEWSYKKYGHPSHYYWLHCADGVQGGYCIKEIVLDTLFGIG